MEQLQNGQKKPRRKRRKREAHLVPENPADSAAATAADNGTSQHRVETYLSAQLEFLDDAAEEVRMHSVG